MKILSPLPGHGRGDGIAFGSDPAQPIVIDVRDQVLKAVEQL